TTARSSPSTSITSSTPPCSSTSSSPPKPSRSSSSAGAADDPRSRPRRRLLVLLRPHPLHLRRLSPAPLPRFLRPRAAQRLAPPPRTSPLARRRRTANRQRRTDQRRRRRPQRRGRPPRPDRKPAPLRLPLRSHRDHRRLRWLHRPHQPLSAIARSPQPAARPAAAPARQGQRPESRRRPRPPSVAAAHRRQHPPSARHHRLPGSPLRRSPRRRRLRRAAFPPSPRLAPHRGRLLVLRVPAAPHGGPPRRHPHRQRRPLRPAQVLLPPASRHRLDRGFPRAHARSPRRLSRALRSRCLGHRDPRPQRRRRVQAPRPPRRRQLPLPRHPPAHPPRCPHPLGLHLPQAAALVRALPHAGRASQQCRARRRRRPVRTLPRLAPAAVAPLRPRPRRRRAPAPRPAPAPRRVPRQPIRPGPLFLPGHERRLPLGLFPVPLRPRPHRLAAGALMSALILQYHAIAAAAPDGDRRYSVSAAAFRRHLALLAALRARGELEVLS